MASDCKQNSDALKLVREGSSQAQRLSAALEPGSAPLDQRSAAHGMLFARAYSAYLKYYNVSDTADGDWSPFFSGDVSVQLALASVQDVASYKAKLKACFAFLDNLDNEADEAGLKDRLGYLFSAGATLAAQLDALQLGLPVDLPFRGALRNLIRNQLAPAFRQLMLYHRDGLAPAGPPPGPWHSDLAAPFKIMGAALTMREVRGNKLSPDWIADPAAPDWGAYLLRLDDPTLYPDSGIYGSVPTLFGRINHIATHNLFTSVFERLLKVYARTVDEAGTVLAATFAQRDTHEPHYALFLAFLRLFDSVREEMNGFTARHLDFYYRDILRLKQKAAQAGKVRLLAELARHVPSYLLAAGTLFKAGKDQLGVDAFYAASRDTVLNQAKVAALKTLYRHDDEPVGEAVPDLLQRGRLYASPMANSDDGLGAGLTSSDGSWHPFHNKQYRNGVLTAIKMPPAEVGFALASHYLLLEQGTRTITVTFDLAGVEMPSGDLSTGVSCLLTTEKGWLEVPAILTLDGARLYLGLSLSGADPAVTPYSAEVHGYTFATTLPLLMLKLRQDPASPYIYASLQDLVVSGCQLSVHVKRLKSLAVSNDFGPVDPSKPFQPYGAAPVRNSAWVVGSTEAFQKTLTTATLSLEWQVVPDDYNTSPQVNIDFLVAGEWKPSGLPSQPVQATSYSLGGKPAQATSYSLGGKPALDQPDLSGQRAYDNSARHGFVRLKLDKDFGQRAYQTALILFLQGRSTKDPGPPPVGPQVFALHMDYSATQQISLASADPAGFASRAARFFHLAPFGQAEQHPLLNAARKVFLLPQFVFPSATAGIDSAAELYVGISGLQPPQSLALLIQVADGTADPQVSKPPQHVSWSYLRANQWVAFAGNEVDDGSAGLLVSGIATLAVPRDASADNTLLPAGMHWIRLAVARETDAACRLLLVAAQALEARFADRGNDPAFAAQALPAGTISKLAPSDPAIKKVSQPFPGFGGRGAEAAPDFYTRISERLRHKDRAIALWDAEHLVLEAFPAIYRAKCLNHTHYEPGKKGEGIYRELAPGHVTIVTIPNLAGLRLRDPLRPATGIDLLLQVEAFLRPRYACFVRLHVRTPQFEQVRLSFRLRLHAGFDETFYVQQLQQEITRFLSPWAFPGGGQPSFGGKIRKSVLLDFVEEREYVDYVTDFQLFLDTDDGAGTADRDEVEGSRAVSILVSAPPEKHQVVLIPASAPGAAPESCPCEAT
ncbi:MAG: hypothetical protein JWP34_2530 [Massilia sp.]|nr:hypothetical protein [Massilia sp.]